MRLLDLFCGAGGTAMGYYRAGFTEIVGIDHVPQPNYPFDFIQADALKTPERRSGSLKPPIKLEDFDLIHASPPCQRFSQMRNVNKKRYNKEWRDYPDLLTPCREMLRKFGVPYVIENVPGAPMRVDLICCGTMFGLRVLRHRWFEISPLVLILTPPCNHNGTVANGDYYCVVGSGTIGMTYAKKAECAKAMGIDWMTRKEMTQAIPPVYTEFLGKEILRLQRKPFVASHSTIGTQKNKL